jgi:hypothetical protein
MSILLFTTKGDIMALNKTNQEELPFPINGVEEEKVAEQISFDDLEFEAEYVDEDQEVKKFYTISGKESWYEPTWEVYKMENLDVGDEFEGRPELRILTNDDKSYDSLQVKVMDDGEIVVLYVPFPKKDFPYVRNINKGFDFYRKCFDFIYSVLRYRDERNVVDANGEEINRFKSVNIETFAKYVDSMTRVGIRITEGNPDSEYDSFIIYKME